LIFSDVQQAISLPFDLPNNWPQAGTNVLISGWGIRSQVNQSIPDQIKAANITVLSSPGSKANCGEWSLYNQYNPSQNLCAGSNDGSDICQGDSGGPYMVTTGGVNYLAGVTSFNAGISYCGDSDFPGQAVRVTSFTSWIVPGEPKSFTWKSSRNSYTLKWKKPVESSAKTSGYLVQSSTDGGLTWDAGTVISKTSTKISCTAADLCEFRVAAVSDVNKEYGPWNYAEK
jgi:secreted trypsin-like serine protease